jgi:hypothetical protein
MTRCADAGIAVFVLAIGCVDTRGKLDEFNERYARTHDGGSVVDDGGACDLPSAPELTGSFALVVSPGFSPKTPIVFRAEVTSEPEGSDRLKIGIELTALSARDRASPVGAPLPRREYSLGAGRFVADLGTLDISGEADPIVPGAPISGQLSLSGKLCSAREFDGPAIIEFLCGEATGTVTAPTTLDLTGSTWAALRVSDPASPPALVLDCAGNPPDPL